MPTTSRNITPPTPHLWGLVGFIAVCVGLFGFASLTFGGTDFSRVYRYGGGIHIPVDNPPEGERPILDANAELDVGGALGCSGLSIRELVKAQIGDFGSSSELGKDIANAAKTKLFREAITRVLANPQVASVLDNLQGLAHARVAIIQERCNANEIFANATNKRLREEALQKCTQEKGSLEVCLNGNNLKEYVEITGESDRWQKGLRFHLCNPKEDDSCDWTLVLPDRRTAIARHQADLPENPPILSSTDVLTIATDAVVDLINERVEAAIGAITTLGHGAALRAALYDQPGLPPEITQGQTQTTANEGPPSLIKPFSLYDQFSDANCKFSAERSVKTSLKPLFSVAAEGIPVFPIAGEKLEKANFSSLFGPRERPCRGCSSYHNGVDLAYPRGTALVSVGKAFVDYAGFSTGAGNVIKLRLGSNTAVSYSHLDEINPQISAGITLPAGARIGTVGSTGTRTTGNHLHFVVRKDGVAIDPLYWLGGADSQLKEALKQTEDMHGLRALAVNRSSESAGSDFTAQLHKQVTQLTTRLASSVTCALNKSLHPHVYIRLALQPGTLGPYNPLSVVKKAEGVPTSSAFLSGDQGAIISGLASLYGAEAAVKFYNAIIDEMSLSLASKNTGIGGINPALHNSAFGELSRLKFERADLINTFKSKCLVAKRVAGIISRGGRALTKHIECKSFDYITDDGTEELRRFTNFEPEETKRAARGQQHP